MLHVYAAPLHASLITQWDLPAQLRRLNIRNMLSNSSLLHFLLWCRAGRLQAEMHGCRSHCQVRVRQDKSTEFTAPHQPTSGSLLPFRNDAPRPRKYRPTETSRSDPFSCIQHCIAKTSARRRCTGLLDSRRDAVRDGTPRVVQQPHHERKRSQTKHEDLAAVLVGSLGRSSNSAASAVLTAEACMPRSAKKHLYLSVVDMQPGTINDFQNA